MKPYELINPSYFVVDKHPQYNPLSQRSKRISYWREIKRRCMEGYWAGGVWMPGELYMYMNTWTIEIDNEELTSSGKILARPWLRDLDWEKAYIYSEAFGFSGFENDKKYTCNFRYDPENIEESLRRGYITEEQKQQYTYLTPRKYLDRWPLSSDLGKPLYHNPAKNIMDIEARGGGKSYWSSVLMGHNFMFDGSHDYEAYLKQKKMGNPMVSQTLVGAINTGYSWDLINKMLVGKEYLPGKIQFGGKIYPSPLDISTRGTLQPGTKPWVSNKSGSKLHHRSYNDSHTAGNGTRPSRVFLEEIGFFHRLVPALGALYDGVHAGARQFGSIMMFGTGGDMEGGATLAAQQVFYSPESFNCVVFEDEWEHRGKIGYFVPATKAINDYKFGENRVTDLEFAEDELNKVREKKRKAPSAEPYNAELQNRPLYPSEAFLDINSNKFPQADLKDREAELISNEKIMDAYWIGELGFDQVGRMQWKPNTTLRPLREYPPDNNDTEGAIEIFVMPKRNKVGEIPKERYIACLDPVDDDDTEGSLQSGFIFDMFTERIVAECTGRTYNVDDFYERFRRLLIYYNATCNYENSKKGFYGYMKIKNSLHYLCATPDIIYDKDLAVTRGGGNKAYGTPAVPALLKYGTKLYESWLKKEATFAKNGENNARMLPSLGLVRESMSYNPEGNFDRVSAMKMLFILYADRIATMGKWEDDPMPKKNELANDPFFTDNWNAHHQAEQQLNSHMGYYDEKEANELIKLIA